jgi:hypothetical protein
MTTFVGHFAHFSIDHPKSWSAGETPTSNHGDYEAFAEIFAPGPTFPQAILARKAFPEGDIIQVAKWGETRVEQQPDYVTTALQLLDTARYVGLLREYHWISPATVLQGTQDIHCEDWYTLAANVGYDLAFCAVDKDWPQVNPIFRQMMESFSVQ